MPDSLWTARHFLWGRTLSVIAARCQLPRKGELNSLSQNLTVLPAPSGREPLAWRQTLHFSRELYRYAKGPISEGAGCDQREQTGGVQARTLSVIAARCQLPRKGEPLAVHANFISLPRPLPLGEVDLRSKDGEGEAAAPVQQIFPVWKTTVCVRFPHRVFRAGGLWKTARGKIPDWRKANL